MAEKICIFTKDVITIRSSKKPSSLLRTTVFVFVMVSCVFICSVCLKQTHSHIKSNFFNTEVIDRPCHVNGIDRSEHPYVHYPKPRTFRRDECACNPVRLFAILTIQRSGSGWFETLLNSHVNVTSNGEIFSLKERRDNISSIVTTLDRVYNLDWLTSAAKNECSAAVGLKWMLNQHYDVAKPGSATSVKPAVIIEGLMENHEEIVEYFNNRGVSVIFLFRRNLLRRMVSLLANSYDRYAKLLNGTHKSHVHSAEEAEVLSSYKPIIKATTLVMELNKMEVIQKEALEHFKTTRHTILYYEDLVKNKTKLAEVQDFLRLPTTKLTSRQVKIHKGPLSEHIKNWDEVCKILRGTTYEGFLDTEY